MSTLQLVLTYVLLFGSVVAIISTFIALIIAHLKKQEVEDANENGPLKTVTTGNVTQEALRFTQAALFVLTGTVALLAPPGHVIRSLATAALLVAVLLLPVQSLLAHRTRRRANRQIRAQMAAGKWDGTTDRRHDDGAAPTVEVNVAPQEVTIVQPEGAPVPVEMATPIPVKIEEEKEAEQT